MRFPNRKTGYWTLVSNLVDPRVGAAYCRNVPRQGAHPLARRVSQCDLTYAPGRREQRLPVGLSGRRASPRTSGASSSTTVTRAPCSGASCGRRHPYPRTRGGEDVLMARALIEAGLHGDLRGSRHRPAHARIHTRPSRAPCVRRRRIRIARRWGACASVPEDAAASRPRSSWSSTARSWPAEGYDAASAREELARAEARHRRFFAALAEGARTSRRAPPGPDCGRGPW